MRKLGIILIVLALVGVVVGLLMSASCAGAEGPAGAAGAAGATGATGPAGATGPQGPRAPGFDSGMNLTLGVSTPANGTHFVVGEVAVVTVTLDDGFGDPLSVDDFTRLNLYMYGPQDPNDTVTASKLLNASTDRAQTPHHHINLLDNTDVSINGNSLEYTLQPVSDEKPGTYTVSLWTQMSENVFNQRFELADIQIGTAEVETQVVEKENCASCHLGAETGEFYLHHIDPGYSPTGNPSLDSWPVKTCKSCHNNDGYAAYRLPSDPDVRVPDPIINRVHGVHNGANLESVLNETVFADYLHVEFPADVRNCTTCHVDDSWKNEPSQLACGACHDNIWFGAVEDMLETAEAHPGGPQIDDSACAACHTADAPGLAPISEVHLVESNPAHSVDIVMSAPANGEFYVGGETPTLTISVTDSETGSVVDPSTITEDSWSRVRLQVSGPRENTMPVLTSAAADHSLSGSTSYIYVDLRVDAPHFDPMISRSATAISYQLADVDGLESGTYTVFVQAREVSAPSGVKVINFQVGTATVEPQIATSCTDCHGTTNMHGSYPFSLAPDICKACHDYENQLEGNTDWDDRNWGFGAAPLSRRVHGVHFGAYLDKPGEIHGEEDAEHYAGIIFPQDVRNCTKCHSESDMWKQEPSRLACNACHDSDSALTHTSLMTIDPTPEEPWSGDEMESCDTCHGAGRDFAPDVVHNISDPYVPPYPRH